MLPRSKLSTRRLTLNWRNGPIPHISSLTYPGKLAKQHPHKPQGAFGNGNFTYQELIGLRCDIKHAMHIHWLRQSRTLFLTFTVNTRDVESGVGITNTPKITSMAACHMEKLSPSHHCSLLHILRRCFAVYAWISQKLAPLASS